MTTSINGTTGIVTGQLEVTGRGYSAAESLTDQATVVWDWATGQTAELSITANRILANPINAVVGEYAALRVSRTGAYQLSLGNLYKGISTIAQSVVAGYVDHFVFRYNGTNFELVSFKANVGG